MLLIIGKIGYNKNSILMKVKVKKREGVVITYNSFKHIIEMKIWRRLKYHEAGVEQLCDYLDIHGLDRGYLLVFNFNKNKEFKEERINIDDKEIFQVYV